MAGLVEIKSFYDPEEALCARGYLEANGVQTFLLGEHHLGVEPWLRIGLGGYRMYVLSKHLTDAMDLLKAIPTPQTDSTTDELPFKRKTNWAWLPIAITSGVPFLPKFGPTPVLIFQSCILTIIYLSLLFLT